MVDGQDFIIWNSNKFTGPHGADGFMRGDATGDDIADGADFIVWNTWKFQSFTEWPGAAQSSSSGWGPSETWLRAYHDLLERHEVIRDGFANSSLSQGDWDLFADRLVALLDRL